MKTIVILVGPNQVDQLIDDLKSGQMAPDTRTVAIVLSDQSIQVHNGVFTPPSQTSIYVGPIYTLGFPDTVEGVRKHLGGEHTAH